MEIFVVRYMDRFLHDIRQFYEVIGAATDGGDPQLIRSHQKPIALVLGNEEEGLAPEVAAECSRVVTIPGCGRVESLNVAAAAAVLIWECARSKTNP